MIEDDEDESVHLKPTKLEIPKPAFGEDKSVQHGYQPSEHCNDHQHFVQGHGQPIHQQHSPDHIKPTLIEIKPTLLDLPKPDPQIESQSTQQQYWQTVQQSQEPQEATLDSSSCPAQQSDNMTSFGFNSVQPSQEFDQQAVEQPNQPYDPYSVQMYAIQMSQELSAQQLEQHPQPPDRHKFLSHHEADDQSDNSHNEKSLKLACSQTLPEFQEKRIPGWLKVALGVLTTVAILAGAGWLFVLQKLQH